MLSPMRYSIPCERQQGMRDKLNAFGLRCGLYGIAGAAAAGVLTDHRLWWLPLAYVLTVAADGLIVYFWDDLRRVARCE